MFFELKKFHATATVQLKFYNVCAKHTHGISQLHGGHAHTHFPSAADSKKVLKKKYIFDKKEANFAIVINDITGNDNIYHFP